MARFDGSDPKLKLFISYSRGDIEAADSLVTALEARDFEITIDRRDLPYGEEWQRELADFIRGSDTVLWLVSPNSVKSKWCNWELGEVTRLNKRLVPVAIAPVSHDALPEAIGKIHLLPAQGAFVPSEHLDTLVTVLNTNRQWLKEATRLADRAAKWLASDRSSDLLLRGRALREARAWMDARPTAAPPPSQEQLDYVLASQRGQTRRQRNWILGSVVAISIIAQIGFLSLFYQNDSRVNQVRNQLQHNRLADAQAQFRLLTDNPINRLLPISASASSLASELLDAALIENLFTLPGARGEATSGQLIHHDGRLAGLIRTGQSHEVLHCGGEGRDCAVAALGDSWPEARLLRDGADLFVLSWNYQAKVSQAARLVRKSGLNVEPQVIDKAVLPQSDANRRLWTGAGYVWSSTGNDVFSTSPPVTQRTMSLPGVPHFDATLDRSLTLADPARCSADLGVCIGRFTDVEQDARGTIKVFDVWARRFAPGNPGTDKQWVRLVPRLYQPPPSSNAIAVSSNGRLIAITRDKLVNVWRYSEATREDRRPWKSLQLADIPLDIAFEPDTERLLVLDRRGLRRIDLQPRATVLTPALPDNSLPAADEKTALTTTVDADRILLRQGRSVVVLVRSSGKRIPLYEADPKGWPTVEVRRPDGSEDPIAAIHDSGTNQVSIFRFPRTADPVKAAVLPGKVVTFALGGRAVVTDLGKCQLRLQRVGADSPPLPIEVEGSNCGSVGSWEIDRRVIDDRSELLIYRPASDAAALIAQISVSDAGAIRLDPVAAPRFHRSSSIMTDRFVHYVSNEAELVTVGIENGRVVRWQRKVTDADTAKRIASALAGGQLSLLADDHGAFAIFLGYDGCGVTDTRPAVYTSNLLLLSADQQTVAPQFLLTCIPAFPARPGAFDSYPVMSQGSADRVYVGALFFPGVFEWDRRSAGLKLLLFEDRPRPGQVASIREAALAITGDGGTTAPLKHVAFPGLALSQAVPSMTQIAHSDRHKMLAFFALTGRSGGHDRNLSVADLDAKTVRTLENETESFFDVMKGASLSPNGRLVISDKDFTAIELFRTDDGARLALPAGTKAARFLSDTEIELTLETGARLRWAVPEGDDQAFDHLRRTIAAASSH